MNEETRPADVLAPSFSILLEEHAAKEADRRAKEAMLAARIAAHIEHDRQFIDLENLSHSIARRHGLGRFEAERIMNQVLDIESTQLFCRWLDPGQHIHPDNAPWAPLPDGPVARVDEEVFLVPELGGLVHMALLTSPRDGDPGITDLLGHLRMRGGWLDRNDLAIRREDACRLFGLADIELLDRRRPLLVPAQFQEDATETHEAAPPASSASAPAAAGPEPVAPSAVATDTDSASASPAALPEPVAGTAGGWWLTVPLLGKKMKSERLKTAKELYRALELDAVRHVGPFDKVNGCLYVREFGETMSLKTLQNRIHEVRAAAGLAQ